MNSITVGKADIFRTGNIVWIANEWVEIAPIPCKQSIVSDDLAFLHENNFIPFV